MALHAGHGKIKRAASAGGRCVEHPRPIFGVKFGARGGGSVNYVAALASWKIEISDVSAHEGEASITVAILCERASPGLDGLVARGTMQ